MANEHENRDMFENALLVEMGVPVEELVDGDGIAEAGGDWNQVARAYALLRKNAGVAMDAVKSGNEANLLRVSSIILSNMAVGIGALARKDPALKKAIDWLAKAASVIMQSHPSVGK